MYALQNLLGVLSAKKCRDGARHFFTATPPPRLFKHTFLHLFSCARGYWVYFGGSFTSKGHFLLLHIFYILWYNSRTLVMDFRLKPKLNTGVFLAALSEGP